MITAEHARKILDYNPETGDLVWKYRPLRSFSSPPHGKSWNSRNAGKVAGSTYWQDGKYTGYTRISIGGRRYPAHCLAWLIHYGEKRQGVIDHIDGDGTNNRISNLRDATRSENSKNARVYSRNTSGLCGVRYIPHKRKWEARITSEGVRTRLGYHYTIFDAACARRSAEVSMGFTDRHGV